MKVAQPRPVVTFPTGVQSSELTTMPPSASTAAAPVTATDEQAQAAKETKKVRAAWIAFFGRVIAQLVGAAATVTFAMLVLQRAPAMAPATDDATHAAPPVASIAATHAAGGRVTIAVLPLSVLADTPDRQRVGDNITMTLRDALADRAAWRVVTAGSAQYLLDGSVTIAGGRVRLIVQLVDGANHELLWSRSFEQSLANVLALQAQAASAVRQGVEPWLAPEE